MKLSTSTLAAVIATCFRLAHASENLNAPYPASINCGTYQNNIVWTGLDNIAPPDYKNLREAANDLWTKGGTCISPAGDGKCIRVGCVNTTGIWMCNTRGSSGPYSTECQTVSSFVYRGEDDGDATHDIWMTCQNAGMYAVTSVSGQAFVDGGEWNVITGYANCNHSPSNPPDNE